MYRMNLLSVLLFLTLVTTSALAQSETLYKQIKIADGSTIPYAVHLPPDFDPVKTYPVLIGPGDAAKEEPAGFYWRTEPYQKGWIIVDTPLWEDFMKKHLGAVLDQIQKEYKVEGNKFHTVCWSANSAGIFDLAMANADRFHSITGMAGDPGKLNEDKIASLKKMKVQFVVGENDSYWRRAAEEDHKKLKAAGVETYLEIIPKGGHILRDLIGGGFISRLEKLRQK